MELREGRGIYSALRRYGFFGFMENFLLKVASILLCGRVERKLILVRDFQNLPDSDGIEAPFTIRRMRAEELTGQQSINLASHPNDYVAVGAFTSEGVLAGEGWICFRTLGWPGGDDFSGGCNLEPGDAYFFMAWTAPEFRGRGLHKQILLARLRECDALGYRRAVIRVDGFNRASRIGIERAGFSCAESFFIVKAFGKIWNGMRYGKEA